MSSLSRFPAALAAVLALLIPAAASAQRREAPIGPAALRAHVEMLASERFSGRQPGSPGETLTTNYIIRELTRRGVQPGAPGGGWLQPVPLVERRSGPVVTRWRAGGRDVAVPAAALLLSSRDAHATVTDAPVIFAGHGAVIPSRGIDQLAGTDLRGAVALILYDGPDVEDFPSFSERRQALVRAGAVAVIGIFGPEAPWTEIHAQADTPFVQLAEPAPPPVFGAMSWSGAEALVRGGGRDLAALMNDQPGSSFRAVPLPIRASLDVSGQVRAFTSNNVIGRIPGSGGIGESVVLLAHWDHLGVCRPNGAICPGAVDNASGVAAMIEAAGRLVRGPRPVRDVLILATTAEESGLLGAEWFATRPPGRIVAALNTDTAAIAPAGMPVAVMGGTPAMEQLIGRVAVAGGRRLDMDRDADVLAERQDGFALLRHGIPAAMTGGSFSDMARLGAFLQSKLHTPDDRPSAAVDYGGAAEDANLLVALARAFADPAQYRSASPPAAAAAAPSAGE